MIPAPRWWSADNDHWQLAITTRQWLVGSDWQWGYRLGGNETGWKFYSGYAWLSADPLTMTFCLWSARTSGKYYIQVLPAAMIGCWQWQGAITTGLLVTIGYDHRLSSTTVSQQWLAMTELVAMTRGECTEYRLLHWPELNATESSLLHWSIQQRL